MTGQYSFANHVYGNCNTNDAPYNVELATDAKCWSDVLHANGYSLGYVGKWHLDSPYPPYIPTSNNKGKVKWNEWASPNRRHGFDSAHPEEIDAIEWFPGDFNIKNKQDLKLWEQCIKFQKQELFYAFGHFRKQDDGYYIILNLGWHPQIT
jgi:arylsulfatase A-like enzyme